MVKEGTRKNPFLYKAALVVLVIIFHSLCSISLSFEDQEGPGLNPSANVYGLSL